MSKLAKVSYALYAKTVGKLVDLTTTAKNNIVAAINELKVRIDELHTPYLGTFASFDALKAAYPEGGTGEQVAGQYALVDEGEGKDVVKYLWDDNDKVWVKQNGRTSEVTNSETNGNILIGGVETVVFVEEEITETAFNALTPAQQIEKDYIVIPD